MLGEPSPAEHRERADWRSPEKADQRERKKKKQNKKKQARKLCPVEPSSFNPRFDFEWFVSLLPDSPLQALATPGYWVNIDSSKL